jgi:hypothetical protein
MKFVLLLSMLVASAFALIEWPFESDEYGANKLNITVGTPGKFLVFF